jgi:hypothetical protein
MLIQWIERYQMEYIIANTLLSSRAPEFTFTIYSSNHITKLIRFIQVKSILILSKYLRESYQMDISLSSIFQTGGMPVLWLDLFGIFLFIAGFIVGLGAVTVIDIHGFLGRKSAYWTEATTRTHKVTKPLIWIGLFLAISGALITYRNSDLSGIPLLQAIIAVALVLNGLFLSFYVSPYMMKREREGRAGELLPDSLQIKIALSFVVSFAGWWSEVFLLVWYIVMVR